MPAVTFFSGVVNAHSKKSLKIMLLRTFFYFKYQFHSDPDVLCRGGILDFSSRLKDIGTRNDNCPFPSCTKHGDKTTLSFPRIFGGNPLHTFSIDVCYLNLLDPRQKQSGMTRKKRVCHSRGFFAGKGERGLVYDLVEGCVKILSPQRHKKKMVKNRRLIFFHNS